MPIKTTQPVQLWDGVEFTFATEAEARILVQTGTHIRTLGLTGAQLPGRDYFKRDLKAEEQKPKPKARGKIKPRSYRTTQMKAE